MPKTLFRLRLPRLFHKPLAVVAGLALALGATIFAAAQRAEYADPRRQHFQRLPTPDRTIFPGNGFTFARVRYTSTGYMGGPWYTDYPDSDLNFSQRLAEITSLHVNQEPVVVDLTDPALCNYPFIYMIEVGSLEFQDEEIAPLRDYLLRGGFLMVDDFWGEDEFRNWEREISRVLPPEEYPMIQLPFNHEIFHVVFDLNGPPQIPSIHHWRRSGRTTERHDAPEARCWGIFDKNNRLMVVVMHNTDLGDGWEREGEDEEYFWEFSAKRAYPMGVNIVVYAMTH